MKTRTLIVYVVSCFLCMAGSALAQKGGGGKPVACTNPSLAVTILPIIDGISAITGDVKGFTYTNGVDGVYNGVINLCPSGPTAPNYDATFGLVGSKRSMGFSFQSPISESIIDGPSPVWANGKTFLTKPYLNIRNILWGRLNGQTTFTTRMIIQYIKGPGDSSSYGLRFQNPVTDAVTEGGLPNTNKPSDTARVTVQDVPGTCRSDPDNGTKDSWIVTVDPSFVGTLTKMDNNWTHSGQYTMAMRFLVEAKTCLPSINGY